MSKLWASVVKLIYDIGDHSGCHQMPERSFYWKGRQFPVCARCTGVFIGQTLAVILAFLVKIPTLVSVLFLSIMGIDWGLQEFKIKESTNYRRLLTGILGGFGLYSIYANIIKYIFRCLKNRSRRS